MAQQLESNWKQITERIILSCVILMVWGLFALPTVFYGSLHLQSGGNDDEVLDNSSYLNNDGNSEPANISAQTTTDLDRPEVGTNNTVTCAEGFYLDNSSSISMCKPLCAYWLSTSRNLSTIVIQLISKAITIAASLIIFVLAFRLQRDILLVHPTVYLVYVCLALTVGSPAIIFLILNKGAVYCQSKSLSESLETPTPLCTISGILHTYILVQISMWILFHALGILGGVEFPFKYRIFKAEGKVKYVHISTVVIGIIIPLVPALLPLIDGYSIIPSSLDVCFSQNPVITYFTLVLPFSILFALATTILIAMFWKIVKEFALNQILSNVRPKKQIRNAQAKILMIMCCYIIVGVLTMTSYTFFITSNERILESYQTYFLCQSIGVQPDIDCGEPPKSTFHTLASVPAISLGLLPGVILTFTVKCTCTGKYFKGVKRTPDAEP